MDEDFTTDSEDPGPEWAQQTVAEKAPSARALLSVIWHSRNSALVQQAVTHPAIQDRTLKMAAIGDRLEPHASVIAFCERESVLREWAASPDAEIRTLVAFNPSTPGDVALTLIADPVADVRANAAYHPSIPEEVLRALSSSDSSKRVREAALDALSTEFGQALRSGQRTAYIRDADDLEAQDSE